MLIKQEYFVNGQWVEFTNMKDVYPGICEIANELDSNGRPTTNAERAMLLLYEVISTAPCRFTVDKSNLSGIIL